MSEIEERLRVLRRELRGTSRRRRRRVLAEARDHLLCALEDGLSEAEAVARLGELRASFAGLPGRHLSQRFAVVAGPIMLLALAPSLGGTLQMLGAGTPTSQAAASTGPTKGAEAAAVRRCVAAWNSEASGRWRTIAVQGGIQRADVGVYWTGKVRSSGPRLAPRIAGCTVRLQGALVPSPYQPFVYVYAKPAHGSYRFESLRRGRSRTAAPATNARVDSAGHLALSARLLPAICPAASIGSRIVSVRALSDRDALLPSSITQLHAGPRQTFLIVVRNDGQVAIEGAIGSLDVSGSGRPGRPWWRSGPRVVSTLEPGASISLRFTPPPLGHGVRLLRATTAVVACESRISDNSGVFRVRFK